MARQRSVLSSFGTLFASAALAASCSSAPSAAPGSAPASSPATSQWRAVLSGIGADGSVDVATATAAFSLAIAPLPGATLPDGATPTPKEIVDGSGPVRWLVRNWANLTQDQQAAAQRLIDGIGPRNLTADRRSTGIASVAGNAAEPAIRLAADPTPADTGSTCGIWLFKQEDSIATVPAPVRAYAEDLNAAAVAFAGHLGRDPVAKWAVCLLPSGRITAGSATVVFDANSEQSGEPDHCLIGLNSDYFTDLKSTDQGRYGYSIAMAAFRCFLETAAFYGPSTQTAPYVEEGLTAWSAGTVAQEVFGGPGTALAEPWDEYLTDTAMPLYERNWDAVGFYAQLNEIEPMWQFVDPMLRADGAENAFYASGARDPKFAKLWAAGYFRDEADGADWEILGPGVTPAKADRADISVDSGQETDVSAPALAVSISEATSAADVTYITGTDLRIADGSLDNVIHSDEIETTKKAYCTKDGGGGDCTCPPDSLGAKLPVPPALKSPFHVALTGMLDGGGGSLTGVTLADFCGTGPSAAPDNAKGGPNPCAAGCAGSIGDTHLRTIDLQQYDFQAAGEYVLLRSADGSMEIQARAVPYPGISDTSINVAFAWKVAGHKVTMYSRGSSYEVRLDGKPEDPAATGTVDLGQGGSLTPLREGVEVAFPDGTITTAIFHGNGIGGALDLEIAASAALKQGAVGLLGPIARDSELPALPDGTALPLSTDRATRYQQRYGQLGPAWHVTAQTSLFDYDAGQSSTTFDEPGFPTANVAFDVKELEARIGTEAEQEALGVCNEIQNDAGLYDACVYDVIATTDPTFGHFYEEVRNFLADGPQALDTCNPPAAPGGFGVVPCVTSVTGVAVAPDGSLALGILTGAKDAAAEVIAVDPTNGNVARRIPAGSNARVAVVGGSLWVGTTDFTGDVGTNCILRRVDPATYREQAKIAVPCGSDEGDFVATADAIWVVDGASLRPVDLASNTLGAGIALPVGGAKLLGTDSVVFAALPNESPGTWYRLGPGDHGFSEIGPLAGTSGLDPIVGGGALWLQDFGGSVSRFTTSTSPAGPAIAVDGTLVAADDAAVYVARDDQAAGHFELWRYPLDGSAATKIAENNLSFPITNGSVSLQYDETARIVIAAGKVLVVWQVPAGIGQVGSVLVQAVALP